MNGPIEIATAMARAPATVFDSEFPSRFGVWQNSSIPLQPQGTHFGAVVSGTAVLKCELGEYHLSEGMYFSVPSTVLGSNDNIVGSGCGFLANRVDFAGFFHIGGPAEQLGRLQYIDGCSDSLLISPVVIGAPCLNLLHLPLGTEQTQHTHPSCRLGMIASGSGVCKSPHGEWKLSKGMSFRIDPGAMHSFHTTNEELRVFACHPDSDTGPSQHDHPMINRTIIDGVSAAKIASDV